MAPDVVFDQAHSIGLGHRLELLALERAAQHRVETTDEAAVLRDLGVDYGQGWHYGRPGPPEVLSSVPSPLIPAPRQRRTETLYS